MSPQKGNSQPENREGSAGAASQSQENNVQGQTMAQNPNPRANENTRHTSISTEDDQTTTDVGSEITDGEGG